MPDASPLSRLLSSRKAMILILVVVALSVLCGLGKVTSAQLLTFITVSLPAWLLAQGFEDGLVKPAAMVAATATADRAAGVLPSSAEPTPSTTVDVTVTAPASAATPLLQSIPAATPSEP